MTRFRKRQVASGIVTRKIPTDSLVRTVFGTEEVAEQRCTACNKMKFKFEFYLESASKRKYATQTRKQCVECWDIYKGSSDINQPYYVNKIDMKEEIND